MGRSKRKNSAHVLRYSRERVSQGTVRRHYLRWRQEQKPPIPLRCDNPECYFHTNALEWNGKRLTPILDHIDGNNSDNRPRMLRLLCPNCDSQLPTRGGGNQGRIEKSDGGFAIVSRSGKKGYTLIAEVGHFSTVAKITGERESDEVTGRTNLTWQGEANQFDITDCEFDNDIIVGGGTIVVDGLAWQVPDGASHVIGSENVSMTLLCGNW